MSTSVEVGNNRLSAIKEGAYFVRLHALHSLAAASRGIATDLPMLIAVNGSSTHELSAINQGVVVGEEIALERVEQLREIVGFIAVVNPVERVVDRIRAGCFNYTAHSRNPMYIKSEGEPRELTEGALVRGFSIPDQGILNPICRGYEHEGFDSEFSFEITTEGEVRFKRNGGDNMVEQRPSGEPKRIDYNRVHNAADAIDAVEKGRYQRVLDKHDEILQKTIASGAINPGNRTNGR